MSRLIIFNCLLIVAMMSTAAAIMVPTGKLTPITPAKSTPRPIYYKNPPPPAPVVEYSYENPEPPPIDPSFVPIPFQYIDGLISNGVHYVPIKLPYYGSVPISNKDNIATNSVELQQDASKVAKPGKKFLKKPLYNVPAPYPYDYIPTKAGYPKKVISEKIYRYDLYRRFSH